MLGFVRLTRHSDGAHVRTPLRTHCTDSRPSAQNADYTSPNAVCGDRVFAAFEASAFYEWRVIRPERRPAFPDPDWTTSTRRIDEMRVSRPIDPR